MHTYVENIVNLAHAAQRAATSADWRKFPNKPANQRKDNKRNNQINISTNDLFQPMIWENVCSNRQTVAENIVEATAWLKLLS